MHLATTVCIPSSLCHLCVNLHLCRLFIPIFTSAMVGLCIMHVLCILLCIMYEIMFSPAFVPLSVCLSLCKITRKVLHGL